MLTPYKVIVNLLVNSLFTHPADTKQHLLSFGVHFVFENSCMPLLDENRDKEPKLATKPFTMS